MNNQLNNRLISLDAFRGFVIAGMIIVNSPGTWSHVYGPLLHADWHGITPTDYVFPFFLFIVGVSIVLAYSKRLKAGANRSAMMRKLFKRAAIIFLLGVFLWVKGQLSYSETPFIALMQKLLILFLVCGFLFYSDKWKIQSAIAAVLVILAVWWFPENSLEKLRIPGVLQRIALVFLACSLLFINTKWKTQLWIGISLLIGYWLLLAAVPVPVDDVIQLALDTGQVKAQSGMIDIGAIESLGNGYVAANLEPGTNLEAWLDRRTIPWRMWQHTWDPEGLLSTLPSIASGIAGMLIGQIITSVKNAYEKVSWIFLFGILMYTIGGIWKWGFPFNKNLWTSSFVLHTAGLSAMTLAAMILIVDISKYKKWCTLGRVFGSNSITAYVLSGMLGFLFYREVLGMTALNQAVMDGIIYIGGSEKLASFLFALVYVMILYIPVYFLYKRKIFIKI